MEMRTKIQSTIGSMMLIALLLAWPGGAMAQLDICGCNSNPGGLGDFNTRDQNTWPAGTSQSFRSISIPLPEDGVMIFNSFTVTPRDSDFGSLTVDFVPNQANTPVILLVSGNVTINGGSTLSVSGQRGGNGSSGINGLG